METSLYAETFKKKLTRYESSDYTNPNFPLEHLIKDIDLFNNSAQEKGVNKELINATMDIALRASSMGFSREDYSVIYEAIQTELVD